MAVLAPSATVTIDGNAQDFFEFHTSHSVDAGIAQATITVPAPPAAWIQDDVPVVITARRDASSTLRTIFDGRMRGPITRAMTETEGTTTVHADGNLWRFNLPVKDDMAWGGPITPRKLIKQFFLFYGIEDAHVQEFVHPITGVPILLGGVPWFDDGMVICPAGTSPFAFVDRICRLFGYRIYDRPDGRVRVLRISGPPPEADMAMTEGVDLLNVSWDKDLHPIVTYWIAQGASGTNLLGQQIVVESRPRRGVRSQWVPNPPDDVAGTVSDSLLVTQPLADAARIVKEFDAGGKVLTLQAEVIGTTQHLETLNPKQGLSVVAPTVGFDAEKEFWHVGITHDFSASGYWSGVTGWRPQGRPARTAPVEEPEDDDLPQDPLPPAYDDFPFDPETDPDGDPETWEPPTTGPFSWCPPPATAPPQSCSTVTLSEPGWEGDPAAATLVYEFTPTYDSASATVSGETYGGGGTVEIWQSALLVGSTAIPAGTPGVWEPFSVVVTGALVAGVLAEVRIVA